MMIYIGFILSIVFVISFVGFSSKPSPIYGGLVLIVSGGVGCGIVMSFGGSFLGLMVFLIYLGGMLVVFGYTTAMATEQYPEVWVSNATVLSTFILGVLMEAMLVLYMFKNGEVEVVFEFSGMGDWVVCDGGDSGVFNEEIVGVSALYSYGVWIIIVTGWSLFVGVLVVLEVTRGA
uniref:NADH-ubiquinone oxidoreductase chain 6 n=1 Tax=Rhinoceros unicornis TaxID=9809 RepID=NU6M_RHIUN|nr:NADH dehydrogenase subunit 6 [Rhinoceros unicornis]Q96070.1 RecName: Full=NADH-ubiquinone oxidoreductase chain 6; AltName: Full=NADH dehydrogenase subunit 6 [Rhinoceros unicornis]UNJ13915.1 NADH dehydrogenase subunit 6 [Rhinoceros unicornis]UNJ13928.1 NADH dehydrogenase subunit 6 [Rhinoceros unicornis]UNJ13941.1 NADH dehydrogenase subunit 6 [Rhinoceros unicornis]UNJ13954.1 NADH dehydrogenase subunit 6 [Rhinoceros unicornis]UNJ13967.1 NADH dehydrogenase subunit 6 [Rhinoceros unicornis]